MQKLRKTKQNLLKIYLLVKMAIWLYLMNIQMLLLWNDNDNMKKFHWLLIGLFCHNQFKVIIMIHHLKNINMFPLSIPYMLYKQISIIIFLN